MRHKSLIILAGLALSVGLSSCGSWWATTSMGPDLYLDDYFSPGYGSGYYYTPGVIGTPPPPPPSPGYYPGNVAPAPPFGGAPGRPGHGGPNYRPSNNTPNGQLPNVSPGTPEQGGFRGQGSSGSSNGSGATTRR